MSCDTQDLTILQGKTFSRVLRWETSPLVYTAITAVTRSAPAIVTASGHGIPDGWRAAVISAGGMKKINAVNWPLRDTDWHQATYVSASQVSFNDTNSSDYTTYTSGGYLVHYTPVDLASYTARLTIKDVVGGTALLSLTTANSRIALDNTAKTITLTISATDTAALTFTTGVYDLELVSPAATPVVTQLLTGIVTVTDEVTT